MLELSISKLVSLQVKTFALIITESDVSPVAASASILKTLVPTSPNPGVNTKLNVLLEPAGTLIESLSRTDQLVPSKSKL